MASQTTCRVLALSPDSLIDLGAETPQAQQTRNDEQCKATPEMGLLTLAQCTYGGGGAFKAWGNAKPGDLLKRVMSESVGSYVGVHEKLGGLRKVDDSAGDVRTPNLFEEFFEEQDKPNSTELELLAKTTQTSDDEVKEWFSWKSKKVLNMTLYRYRMQQQMDVLEISESLGMKGTGLGKEMVLEAMDDSMSFVFVSIEGVKMIVEEEGKNAPHG